jgi:hypothetical protein
MQTPFILLYTIIMYVVIIKLVSHSRLHRAHNVHLRKILKMFLDPAMLSIQQQILARLYGLIFSVVFENPCDLYTFIGPIAIKIMRSLFIDY